MWPFKKDVIKKDVMKERVVKTYKMDNDEFFDMLEAHLIKKGEVPEDTNFLRFRYPHRSSVFTVELIEKVSER